MTTNRVLTTTQSNAATLADTEGQPYPVAPANGGSNGVLPPLYSVVLRPGDTTGADNVFTTWEALYAACKGIAGGVLVLVDDSLISPVVIPSGHWTIDEWEFRGVTNPVQEFATLQLADGALLTCSALYVRNLEVETIANAPNFTAGAILYVEAWFSTFTASAGGPMFAVPSGANLVVQQTGGNMGDGAFPVITVANGGALEWTGNSSDLEPLSVTGPGAAAGATYFFDASTIVHATPLGTYQANDDASRMAYEPAVVANWSGVAPTSVANALDRIAAHVGPIP
jgi:hypothetical protein